MSFRGAAMRDSCPDINPFRSPSSMRIDQLPAPLRLGLLWTAFYFYPIISVGVAHGYWMVTWATIGHMPQAGRDDPATVFWLSDYLYNATILATVAAPLFVPLGFVACFLSTRGRALTRRTWSVWLYFIAQLPVVFLIIRSDPFGAFSWLSD